MDVSEYGIPLNPLVNPHFPYQNDCLLGGTGPYFQTNPHRMTLIRNTSVQALARGSSEVFGEAWAGVVVIWD